MRCSSRYALILALAVVAVPSVARAQTPETIEYYGADTIGSIRIVFDVNGTVLGRRDFTPFGTPVVPAPTMPKEGFGGNVKDDETDLSYFHARMFQARTGRFTRVDPLFDGIFDPQRWNRYAYADNAPLVFSDPDGDDPYTSGTNGCQEAGHAPIEYYFGGCWGLASGASTYSLAYVPHDSCFFLGCYPYGPPPGMPPGTGTGGTGGTPTPGPNPAPDPTPQPNPPGPNPNPNPNCDPHNPASCGPSVVAATIKGFFKGGFSDCLQVFAGSTLNDLWAIGPGLGSTAKSVGEGAAVSGYALAYQYAASRPSVLGNGGLLFPMKSRIFAPIFRAAKFMETRAVPVAAEALALGHGLYDEYNAFATGQCGR